MKKRNVLILSLLTILLFGYAIATSKDENAQSSTLPQKVIWTAVFYDTHPQNETVTMEYCVSHTPTVMVTTIDEITSAHGVRALNGVYVKYHNYDQTDIDGMHFIKVNATVSGVDADGKAWQMPMKLFEQNLDDLGVTDTVWSTPLCKGKFKGTPTVVSAK